jgi:hypothetical protein
MQGPGSAGGKVLAMVSLSLHSVEGGVDQERRVE